MKSITERVKEIDMRISAVKGTLDSILAIWNQVDRKKQSLIVDLKVLNDQRDKILQGQLNLDDDLSF
jgi:hypothetical protein